MRRNENANQNHICVLHVVNRKLTAKKQYKENLNIFVVPSNLKSLFFATVKKFNRNLPNLKCLTMKSYDILQTKSIWWNKTNIYTRNGNIIICYTERDCYLYSKHLTYFFFFIKIPLSIFDSILIS